jgi:signal transduction histidine kinase
LQDDTHRKGHYRPMKHPETPLEAAQRHVTEGEARCTQQVEVLREMITDHHPEAGRAQQVLAALEDTLDLMRQRLRIEEELSASSADV